MTKRFICLLLVLALTICIFSGCGPIHDNDVTIENFKITGDSFSCIVKIGIDCTKLLNYNPNFINSFGIIIDDADGSDYLETLFGIDSSLSSESYTDFVGKKGDQVFTKTDELREYFDSETNIHQINYELTDTDISFEFSGKIPSGLKGKNLILRAFIFENEVITSESGTEYILDEYYDISNCLIIPIYSITTGSDINGMIYSPEKEYGGNTVTVTAVPVRGYKVTNVTYTSGTDILTATNVGSNTYTFVMPYTDTNIVGTFEESFTPNRPPIEQEEPESTMVIEIGKTKEDNNEENPETGAPIVSLLSVMAVIGTVYVFSEKQSNNK